MCELKKTPNTFFFIVKKETSRKNELLQHPKLKKGPKSNIHLKKTFIVKSLISLL